MRPDDVPVLALLRQSMSFHSERQRVIAENVANANTPGYTPKDLDQADFARALRQEMDTQGGRGVQLQTTHEGHIQGSRANAPARTWETSETPDSETTINGNSVVLEEQMVRAQETRMQYEGALTLYQKSLGLIRMAIKSPGR